MGTRAIALVAALVALLAAGVPCPAADGTPPTVSDRPATSSTAISVDEKPSTPATSGSDTAVSAKPDANEERHTVTIPATVARQDVYEQLKGAIEYVLVSRGGKEYESIFITDCTPADLAAAFARVGLTPGKPASADTQPDGPLVTISAEYMQEGKKVTRPVDEFVAYLKTKRPLKGEPWPFTGSVAANDPESGKEVMQAVITRNLIGLHWSDRSPFFENPRDEARAENLYAANTALLPPPGTAVRIIFERVMPKVPPGTVRAHALVSGRVQGVGFRNWTEGQARKLGLTGWVRNLSDGRVEAIFEGPKEKVDEMLEALKTGPRGARVEKVDSTHEDPTGRYKSFDVTY